MSTLGVIAVILAILAAFFFGMAIQKSLDERQNSHNQQGNGDDEAQHPLPVLPPEFSDLPERLGENWLLIIPRRKTDN